ncbi:LrgB family protein [Hathewaya histolytica]|uniref:LrgB family protein n=1 Tax=Hathewaya histolytica TaxID=1498 RepID=A0A4U9RNA0_HATHI|nr:LrgB family protein [Hathewaya histolytica]VTQ92213.1 LrgB family protein [Hathewaya histolytica]
MNSIINSPIFGITISLISFEIGCFIFKKTKNPIFNPLLIGIIIVITFLKLSNINLETYNIGGAYISFLLGPTTVILAVPLYKKLKLLKEYIFPILIGITVGSTCGIASIIVLGKLFKVDESLMFSLIPKSITTPIGMEVSKQLGGNIAITVSAIIITGILGSIIGPLVCNLFNIKNKIAVGISLGTASHAMGTAKALELGETEGAMSGLAIAIAGLLTVFLAPLIVKLLCS